MLEIGALIELSDEQISRFKKRLGQYRRPYEPIPLKIKLRDNEIATLAANRFFLDVQLNMNYDQALTNVLKAMASFDVGSYDEIAKKIYFTHTSHLRSSQATESASEGVWGWFKDLHSGSKREPGTKVKVNLLGGKDEDTTAERPIYSSDPEIAAKGTSLEDKKGYKVWLGGKVIYVFEDDDQGDVSETGEYTYMGSFQLHFEETLNSVYVQVLNDQGQPARNVYAEEILWRLQQTLAD